MKYYRFKTFTTIYYFPYLKKKEKYMYGLYSVYGNKIAQLYWWLFKNCIFVRMLSQVSEEKLDFPYRLIKKTDSGNTIMAFNMGTPGEEQKISILGFDYDKQAPFFAKFSQKPKAMELSKNEIRILTILKDIGIATQLYNHKETKHFVYLKTECLKGERPKEKKLDREITDIAVELSQIHSATCKEEDGLLYVFAHGDFCPWNLLRCNGKLRLIDWEMADEQPLGFDLFTYIFQTNFLFENKNTEQVLMENKIYIDRYFKLFHTSNYYHYLKRFAQIKENQYKSSKGLAAKYAKLITYCQYYLDHEK